MKPATLIPMAATAEKGIHVGCPLDGVFQTSGIVYKATVTINVGQPTKICTEHSFKTRFYNHRISFNYRKKFTQHLHDSSNTSGS